MVDGTYGIYNGEAHKIGKNEKGELMLYPNSDSEIDDTYVDMYNIGIYSKVIDPKDISESYRLTSYAEYKGYKTFIAREVGDEYDIWVTDYAVAQKLGFDRCDKLAYNKMVKKSDVEVIVEKTPLNW
ncbi:MAG: hypothetical protein K6F71_02030 [Ruminococcus sp.]|uniref:hypothetical protein n=1 Tax=Ruminococcus sp. TaxID=41978 RepID=UPI0025ED8356|nr:hypothetical protein [Ruminococcus sp.]MCR5539604.1 hypothetical protein [Ruminococcus sp.]